MATRTSTQSGNWSSTATWGGNPVPVNGDAVVILAGHEVLFDVDQSSFANGLAASTNNGIIHFKRDVITALKLNGNLTGSGVLYEGERITHTSGWSLTDNETLIYQKQLSVSAIAFEETLGDLYINLDPEFEEVKYLNGQFITDKFSVEWNNPNSRLLTNSDMIAAVRAIPKSFFVDNDIAYVHTSDGADPNTKTMVQISPIQWANSGSDCRSQIILNSSATINLPIIHWFGAYNPTYYTQLDADVALNETVIPLTEDMQLQAGDKIAITSGTEKAPTVETSKGIYTVSSYDSSTRQVTLSSGLLTARLKDDYVILMNRPIKVSRTSGVAMVITSNNHKMKCIGVQWLSGMSNPGTPDFKSNRVQIIHCSFGSSTAYVTPVIQAMFNLSILKCCLCNYNQFVYRCPNPLIEKCICTLDGGNGLFSQCPSGTAKNCIIVGYYGIGTYNLKIVYEDCKLINGATNGSQSLFIFRNCLIQNLGLWTPNSNIQSIPETFGMNTFKTEGEFYNCDLSVFELPFNRGSMFPVFYMKLYNCTLDDSALQYCEALKYMDTPINQKSEFFNHNRKLGNYLAWCKGGKIETVLLGEIDGELVYLPDFLIYKPESADYPVFKDYQIPVTKDQKVVIEFDAKKDFQEGIVEAYLFRPEADPLIDSTCEPILAVSMPDTVNTDETITIEHIPETTETLQLRVLAQNSSGNVYTTPVKITYPTKYTVEVI